MKPNLFFFAFVFGWLLAGCGAEAELATPVATVTDTAVALSPTSTRAIAAPTNTAMLKNTPTPTPFATHTPLLTQTPAAVQLNVSPPPDQIVFLWSPYPRPDGPDPALTTNFYIASPGESIEEWQIESVVTDFFSSPLMRVSPDFSQAAILFSESEELAFNEIRKIGVYDFATNEIQNLTDNQCCLYNFAWEPDSGAIIYSQVNNLFLAQLNGTSSEQLIIDSPFPQDSEIFNPVISSDGMRIAFTLSNPNSLVLYDQYDQSDGEYATVGEISYPSSHLAIAWSPDNQWLAFTNSFNQGLSLVNAESLDIIHLEDTSSRCFPAWDTNAPRLAFTCDNTLYLWDSAIRETTELVKAEHIGPPAWSPDNLLLAASFANDQQTGLILVNPAEEDIQELRLMPPVKPAVWAAPIWSPDADWLLILSEPTELEPHSGVYIIDRPTGTPYLVMETTGLQQPYNLTWLPAN